MKNKKVIVIVAVLAVLALAGIAFALAGAGEKKEEKKVKINLRAAGFSPDGSKKLIVRPELMKNMIRIDPKIFQQMQNKKAENKDGVKSDPNSCSPDVKPEKAGTCGGTK